MQLADLLRETSNEDSQDVWENERTPTSVRRFGVRLHTVALSIRETVAILELIGVDRSHGAVWNRVHTLSEAQSDPPTAHHRESRSTRNRSKLTAKRSGCLRRSAPTH